MKIEWDKPTKYSMVMAIIIYIATFWLAFYLGLRWGEANAIIDQFSSQQTQQQDQDKIINAVTFYCDNNKKIDAVFYSRKVAVSLSDGRSMVLPQTISGSGARYANTDESFVFWNKGDTAFVQEGNATTYENCALPPAK